MSETALPVSIAWWVIGIFSVLWVFLGWWLGRNNKNLDDYMLAGCGEMNGSVGPEGWAGMAVTLNPNDLPVDVSQFNALTFYAKGDGKNYRVSVETVGVRQLDSHFPISNPSRR